MDPPIANAQSINDRFLRWTDLLSSITSFDVHDLMKMQNDNFSKESLGLNKLYLEGLDTQKNEYANTLTKLQNWDGRYEISSSGAVAFEILSLQIQRKLSERSKFDPIINKAMESLQDWRATLEKNLRALSDSERRKLVFEALQGSERFINQFPTWGDYHVQEIQTPLGMIPWLGARFRFGTYPAAGSTSTVNKSSFSPGFDQRKVNFGAMSRHISDLSSLDQNYFILLGGNDGWMGSNHLIDQIPLWRNGEYIQIPLQIEKIRQQFNMAHFELK